MSNRTSAKPHPLKDRWFVSYFRQVRQKQKSKDFEEQQKPAKLDWVSTAEELYATIRSFPPFELWPSDENLVFARDNVDPYYENFPEGTRICVFTRTKQQGDQAISLVLAAVMGEHLRTVTEGECIAHVVRIAHKPGIVYQEGLRVEVWLSKSNYSGNVLQYFTDLFKQCPGIKASSRTISNEPTGD